VRFVTNLFGTESTVYGIVLVTALMAIGWKYQTDLEVLTFIVATTIIFWLTHVYARTAVAQADEGGEPMPVRKAFGEAVRHSSGMLLAMLLPAFFLLLAALHLMDEYVAYFIALLIGIVLLVMIGYLVALRNRRPWWRRILAALITGLLGSIVIVLGILAH
jgi:multidrug transporter EmrE-like cation transporter